VYIVPIEGTLTTQEFWEQWLLGGYRVKVVGITKINEFVEKHADIRGPLISWLKEAQSASWQKPAEIKAHYAAASFLPDNHVIINLKGIKYRLEIVVGYKAQTVLIKRIATHAEYSKW
jgi:mRNA interferase HigB